MGDRGSKGSHGLREFDPDDDEDTLLRRPKVFNPEHRTATEAQYEASARFAAQKRAVREKQQRNKRKRIIAASIGAVVIVAAGIPLSRAVLREASIAESLRKGLDTVSKPVLTLGFKSNKEWLDVPSAGLVIDIPAESCSTLVALAQGSSDSLPLHVERPKAPELKGKGVVWCSCDAERVTVKYDDTSLARVALRWLSTSTVDVGGAEVLATLDVRPFNAPADPLALQCADGAFKGWAAVHHESDLTPLDPGKHPLAARLVTEGLSPTGLFPSARIFSVVRAEKDLCYLALTERPETQFSVRSDDGKRLVSDGNSTVGWCAYGSPRTSSFWRPKGSTGDVLVLSAPADRLGGLIGLRDMVRRLSLRELKLLYEDTDLQADTSASLRGSTVSPVNILGPDSTGLPGKLDSLVVAFALGDKGSYLPEVTPPVPFACLPELAPTDLPRTMVCVQSRPQLWRSDAAAKTQGAAEAKLPFWMAVYGGVTDKEGLRAAVTMLAFARRMNLLGYEPSTTDGVLDQADGATLSGRTGKENTVSVGMLKHAPWFVPLSDGQPWTLEGPCRVVKVPVGKTVHVRGAVPLGGDPNARRVVAWRK